MRAIAFALVALLQLFLASSSPRPDLTLCVIPLQSEIIPTNEYPLASTAKQQLLHHLHSLAVDDELYLPSLIDHDAVVNYMRNIGAIDRSCEDGSLNEGNETSTPCQWERKHEPVIDIHYPKHNAFVDVFSQEDDECVVPFEISAEYNLTHGLLRLVMNEKIVVFSASVGEKTGYLDITTQQIWNRVHSFDLILYDWHARPIAHTRSLFVPWFPEMNYWSLMVNYHHTVSIFDQHRRGHPLHRSVIGMPHQPPKEQFTIVPVEPRGDAGEKWPLDISEYYPAQTRRSYDFPTRPFIILFPYNHLERSKAVTYDGINVGPDSDNPCLIVHHLDNPAIADAVGWVCGSKPEHAKKFENQVWADFCLESIKYHGLWNVERAYLSQFDVFFSYMASGKIDPLLQTVLEQDDGLVFPKSHYPLTMAVRNVSSLLFEANAPGFASAKSKTGVALFLAGSCSYHSRNDYVKQLMNDLEVHSCGVCLNNRPNKCDRDALEPTYGSRSITLISKYKFYLAFENSLTDDFITERFFQALLAGTIPIYYGAANVANFAPSSRSFIDTRDFASPIHLAGYLNYLNGNDTAYDEYHAWRGGGEGGFAKRFLENAEWSEKTREAHFSHFQGGNDVRDSERICSILRKEYEMRKWEGGKGGGGGDDDDGGRNRENEREL